MSWVLGCPLATRQKHTSKVRWWRYFPLSSWAHAFTQDWPTLVEVGSVAQIYRWVCDIWPLHWKANLLRAILIEQTDVSSERPQSRAELTAAAKTPPKTATDGSRLAFKQWWDVFFFSSNYRATTQLCIDISIYISSVIIQWSITAKLTTTTTTKIVEMFPPLK